MKIFKKIKRQYERVHDIKTLKSGDIVNFFSERSDKFISKHPYFITSISESEIVGQQILDAGNGVVYDITTETLRKP